MMLNETDARTKVCPLMSMRYAGPDAPWEGSVGEIKCMASDCMKWRWVPNKSPVEIADRKSWLGSAVPEPTGYCGA